MNVLWDLMLAIMTLNVLALAWMVARAAWRKWRPGAVAPDLRVVIRVETEQMSSGFREACRHLEILDREMKRRGWHLA
jgi:hypothetical protein